MYISKENFMEANLSGICRINVIDYSDYIAEKSHDGGHYAFYTTFVKEEYDDKSWYIMYSSSSDFACCPVCGQFADQMIRMKTLVTIRDTHVANLRLFQQTK